MLLNQKGVAHYLLLLAGLGVLAFLLVSNYAPFKDQLFSIINPKPQSQAAGTKSPTEAQLNTFGDFWPLKKSASTQALPVSPGGGWPTNINDISLPSELVDYYAKTNAGFIYLDSSNGELEDANYSTIISLAKKKALFAALKDKNPNIKKIGYIVFNEGHLIRGEADRITQNPADPKYAEFEAYYVHQRGVLPADYAKSNRVAIVHPTNGSVKYIYDVTNKKYRDYIIPKMNQAMVDMGLDGVMADGMFADALGGLAAQMDQTKVAEWPTGMANFSQELKTQMGTKLLIGNVARNEVNYVEGALFAPGRFDGIIVEDPIGQSEDIDPDHRAHPFHPGFETWFQTKELLDLASRKDKYIWIFANMNRNGLTSTQLNETAQKRYNSYYTAAFLQLYNGNPNAFPAKQAFVFQSPRMNGAEITGSQYNSAAFHRNWDIQLGNPTGPSEQVSPSVHRRPFNNGYVYLNATNTPYILPSVPGTFFSITDGSQIVANQTTVPPKSGSFYVTRAVYDQWAAPPIVTGGCTTRPDFYRSSPMTASGMEVTIRAKTNDSTPYNTIARVEFTTFSNAQVRVREPNGTLGPVKTGAFTYQAGRDEVVFKIYQVNAGQSASVQIKATDICGDYPLWFGGGPVAQWSGNTDTNNNTVQPNFNNSLTNTSMNGATPRVHLEWFETPGTGSYKVYRNNVLINTLTSGKAFDDDTAAAGATYNYQTGAVVNGTEIKGTVKPVTAATPPPAPSFTLNPPDTFCVGSNSHIRMNWAAAPNPPRTGIDSGYFIWRDGVPRVNNVVHATQYDDPVAKNPGQEYTYQIEAYVAPNSAFSTIQKVRAASCTGLFNLSNISGSTTIAPGAQTVTWNMAQGAVKFTLKIDDMTMSSDFNQACNGNDYPGDLCVTNTGSNLRAFTFQSGRTYNVQVFQNNSSNVQVGFIGVQIITTGSPPPAAYCATNPLSIYLNDYFPISQVCDIPN